MVNTIENILKLYKGGGRTGDALRAMDWTSTLVGEMTTWPNELLLAVASTLHSASPTMLLWGDTHLCFFNDGFLDGLRLPAAQVAIGKPAAEVLPEIWHSLQPHVAQVLFTGASSCCENLLIPDHFKHDDQVYWTLGFSPLFSLDGKTRGVTVTCTETTETIRAINDLDASEKKFKLLIDEAPIATSLFVGEDLTIEIANDISLKQWGKDKNVIGKSLLEAIPELKGQGFDSLLRQVMNTGITHSATGAKATLIINGNPEEHYFDYKYKAVHNTEGRIYGVMSMSSDVTNRELARQKADVNEAHFDMLRNASTAMIFYLDMDERYQSYNGVFMRWFNVNKSEVIGKKVREFIGEEAYKKVGPNLIKAYKGETVRYTMFAPTRLNGDKWLDIIYTPDKSIDGNIKGLVVHATDITEHILTLKKIEESELFSRDVIYNSPVAKIVFTGPDMIISLVNENMLSLLGRDKSIQGMRFGDALPELKDSPLVRQMEHVYTTGETFRQSEQKLDLIRYGKPFSGYFNYEYKALRNVAGEIYGIMGVGMDVTDQVVARQRIEQKEKELRELITALPIGICVVSGTPLRVEEVNDRFLIISGKTRRQFQTREYWKVMKEIAPEFEPLLTRVFETGEKYSTEEREMTIQRSGIDERIFTTFQYVPVITAGLVEKVIIMAIEVTHQVEMRKEIEAAVIARTEELAELNINLKRSNSELEQFAYIASHDLQEPIRKISTFTNLLDQSLPEATDKTKDYINKIYSSTDRMTNLIRDVLAFSQIERKEDAFESVDLNEIIKTVEFDFDAIIQEKGAHIIFESMPVIKAIPSQMIQLFSNLVSNSLKYSHREKSPIITITCTIAKRAKVESHPQLNTDKEYYHIKFRDNGIGFHGDQVDRIFKIFQRLHGKTEYEGTGIGLSICRKIMQTHGGHISAAAGEDGGAVFNLLFEK